MEFEQKIIRSLLLASLCLLVACGPDEEPILVAAELAGVWRVEEVLERYDAVVDTLITSSFKHTVLTLNKDGETGEYHWPAAGTTQEILYHHFSRDAKVSIAKVFAGAENTYTDTYDIVERNTDQMLWQRERILTNIDSTEEKYIDRWRLAK